MRKTSIIESSTDWEQFWFLKITPTFEIAVDVNDYPNPDEWEELSGPRKSVKDYLPLNVDGKIMRHFSKSTKTWYETEVTRDQSPIPVIKDITVEVKKPVAIEENTFGPDAREVEEAPEIVVSKPVKKNKMAFASLETFYQ